MARQKTKEREQSRDLYVNSGLTLKEISPIVGVSVTHLSKWSNEDEWELQRTAQQMTSGKLIVQWYRTLQAINTEISDKQNGIPNNGQIDQISKITDAISKLSKKQNLSMYHSVLKDFLTDLLEANPDLAKQFSQPMLDYLKRKATALKNDS